MTMYNRMYANIVMKLQAHTVGTNSGMFYRPDLNTKGTYNK